MSADLLHLGDELDQVVSAGVRLAHVDVIDGVFCPGLTAGAALVSAVAEVAVPDVHLMVADPLRPSRSTSRPAPASSRSTSRRRTTRTACSRASPGAMSSGAWRSTRAPRLETLEPLLDDVELVLLLAVNPGWGGQHLLLSTERRLAEARECVAGREIVVAIDGGITKGNVEHVASLGVDLIVTGSAIYDGVAPADNARVMLEAVRRGHAGIATSKATKQES